MPPGPKSSLPIQLSIKDTKYGDLLLNPLTLDLVISKVGLLPLVSRMLNFSNVTLTFLDSIRFDNLQKSTVVPFSLLQLFGFNVSKLL